MMQGLQNTIWQQFSKVSIQTLSLVSLDMRVITNGLNHVKWASYKPPGPP